ncbi:tetraacyldisaccharide 4'-kinase [Microvirga sp. W0021]|uniref:Tetraacyldisaccharide 4'-kinase n=1 Tax=Hohaiivirga grylli TaxID=3133970 RepID=A0ABV0BI63_9HYPH
MRTPGFWLTQERTLLSRLLSPVAWLYSSIAARRLKKHPTQVSVPVICIGNFTAGGAGKTPTTIAICEMLKAKGEKPFFLSRGYGGTETGPTLVKPEHHTSQMVGDEPLILAKHAPVIISQDRIKGAEFAEAHGATVIIMDDGMQNPYLAKDLTIAVIDGQTGLGNGLSIPAGPLRMAMKHQWPLADIIFILGEGKAGQQIAETAIAKGKPVYAATVKPDQNTIEQLQQRPALAFAGIGRPEKFFNTLRDNGVRLIKGIPFPDHHDFTDAELNELLSEAQKLDVLLVTTEKDYIRLKSADLKAKITMLPVSLSFTGHKPDPLILDFILRKSHPES